METSTVKHVDELKFVDYDIAQEFKKSDGGYYIGTPSLVQLNRNIKRLCDILEKQLGTQTGKAT